MTRRKEIAVPKTEAPKTSDIEEDFDTKLRELRKRRTELRELVEPGSTKPITTKSPTFIIFYGFTSMIAVTLLVLYLKGYFS
jgi:hypothetical protein